MEAIRDTFQFNSAGMTRQGSGLRKAESGGMPELNDAEDKLIKNKFTGTQQHHAYGQDGSSRSLQSVRGSRIDTRI